jgi:tetratricopeptide (TPR) repeat protein
MSDSLSLRDRYQALIDQIVQSTLKGQIRSKEQVYQLLVDGVSPGTGEIFERELGDRIVATKRQSETQTDEFKQAKAERTLRALNTIRGEWDRWQERNQANDILRSALHQIQEANEDDQLAVFLRVVDPNRSHPLNLMQWQELAKSLQQQLAESDSPVAQIAQGVLQGIESWHRLENHLVSWIYDQSRGQLGFEGVPGQRGPWALWAKQVARPVPQSLFRTLAMEQPLAEWAMQVDALDLSDYVELVVIFRGLQQGLVNWFDKLVYDSKVGAKLSISTFLAFAVIWSQLASGFSQAIGLGIQRESIVSGCFQNTLQILRVFAQREYFPLYGGIFASFTGSSLRNALEYLDEPLRQAEGTQEKARILTLLGYSAKAQGQLERSIAFHQQALTIARSANDSICEIANLNHLSRTAVSQEQYAEAINYSQRALIQSRQTGNRLGEANALANLGYSEVFQAQQLEQTDPDIYETAINYLQQGLQLAEKLGDRQSQALCLSSLGIAHVTLDQSQTAIAYLEGGLQASQFSGDLYLQGLNLTYLAEAYYRLEQPDQAIATGCLGMYLLEQIASTGWRQAAGLLTVLQGQLGESVFQTRLQQQRPQIIAVIGVDGYDHLPTLLQQYKSEG